MVELPRELACNRKIALALTFAPAAVARLRSDDPARIEPGARVVSLTAVQLRSGEGVCVNSRLGPQRHARLYSCADHGVIQHECVHGICHLTFGSTGPTWLSEGLAELGNYWKDGDRAIDLPAPVIAYLQRPLPTPGRTTPGGGRSATCWPTIQTMPTGLCLSQSA